MKTALSNLDDLKMLIGRGAQHLLDTAEKVQYAGDFEAVKDLRAATLVANDAGIFQYRQML